MIPPQVRHSGAFASSLAAAGHLETLAGHAVYELLCGDAAEPVAQSPTTEADAQPHQHREDSEVMPHALLVANGVGDLGLSKGGAQSRQEGTVGSDAAADQPSSSRPGSPALRKPGAELSKAVTQLEEAGEAAAEAAAEALSPTDDDTPADDAWPEVLTSGAGLGPMSAALVQLVAWLEDPRPIPASHAAPGVTRLASLKRSR